MDDKIFTASITDRIISKTNCVQHIYRRVTGVIKDEETAEPFEMNTEVLIFPDAGQILPYYNYCRNGRRRWEIVLVSQYRPAVFKTTLEAAGGRLDGESVKTALSRELEEETGINVVPGSISIVLHEYTHPSIFAASLFGGIVKIDFSDVKGKIKAGKKSENERTWVEIFDLIEIMRKREFGYIKIDLMTSRLIDEVAKATGLLAKNY